MALSQLVQILVLVSACILVQAENNQTVCNHSTNQSAMIETATLVKELESEAVAQLTSTVMTLVKSEQERMAKVKAAVAEVKADMTSEMTIKAIVRELKAQQTSHHTMAMSELEAMLNSQKKVTEELVYDMKALHKNLSARLENSERKKEGAITDASLAPINTSWIMESFKQLGQRLDDIDHQLNHSQGDLELIKQRIPHDYQNCAELYQVGKRTNGVYTIHPRCGAKVKVYCDMVTDGGGWTVFQKRYNGEVDFYRGWGDYALGFGDPEGDYWLGLHHIHSITQSQPTELYVRLTDFDLGAVYAKYGIFYVSSEAEKFGLHVDYYSGNASDSLQHNNGQKFSTKGQDNDNRGGKCSKDRHGAWWYKDCTHANLNGRFSATKVSGVSFMTWFYLHSSWQSMRTSVMMMRPANFNQ